MTYRISRTRIGRSPARWLPAALVLASAPPALAQQMPPDSTAVCPQGLVSDVFVDNHSVFDLSDSRLNPRFDWAYRLADRMHSATRESVIRRELLFEPGDCYDVERLRDSERLLRDLDFIAGVDIYGVRQADGTIHVIVDTRDEWSLRVSGRWGGAGEQGLTRVEVSEANLLGSGQHVGAFYRRDQGDRGWGARYFTPQLLGTRWDALLEGGRTPVGYLATEAVAYPFVGEVGRWAFLQSLSHSDTYFEYLTPGSERLLRAWYPERRFDASLGGAYRWGRAWGMRTVVGAVLTGSWIAYPAGARYAPGVTDAGPLPPPSPIHRDSIASVRANFLLGQRNVYFVREHGLDTVNGTEDVRLGVESEISLGPSIPALSTDRDFALEYTLFLASRLPGLGLGGANLALQARRNYGGPADRPEWSDVFGQFDGWFYLRPRSGSRSELVAAISAVAGWHDVVPFQLTLGNHTGLRGYPSFVDAGGQRVVATLEHRRYHHWPYPDLFDFGTVEFVDVGKLWAGDAPFGANGPLRADAGIGLRVAFPPGSRQTLRLDVGFPLERSSVPRSLVVTVGIGQLVGVRELRPDPQLLRSIGRQISSSYFNVPR
ncbi:MAG TPA: hypothetical protein VFL93_09675 [Longimicrobiaceae bacterium]|nr:hypothetical protein [Longimicrobiaceae bacterium]